MQLQWIALALLSAWMLVDHLVVWPGFLRRQAAAPVRARHALWAIWGASLWGLAAVVVVAWVGQDTPLAALGLAWPLGWRLWAPAIGIVAILGLQGLGALRVARMSGHRQRLREQMGSTAQIMPRDGAELPAWLILSVTAGFCEELLFRGFLVCLLQPYVGPWLAAAVAVGAFALGHAYQGREGLVRTAVLGAAFMALFICTRSLWPGILLHTGLDFIGGWIGLLILREPPTVTAGGT